MNSNDIRRTFIEYFVKNGHSSVDSSPVVPQNDPTLLFANAGMNQFKNVFVGLDRRPYTRAASCQKCIRAGGKHNDLDNVGKTPRHHTFFEMLGNFSFGDYFKEDAISFAWELLTGIFEIPEKHLWVSVYEEDADAEMLWKKCISPNRIVRLGKKDNFWEMGETGPCGPCTEIHLDLKSFFGSVSPENSTFDDHSCLELWNLVFMQFNRREDGSVEPLPKPSVDTGAGLERIASVLQQKHSNYETDIFAGLIDAVVDLSNMPYTPLDLFSSSPMSTEDLEAGMPHRVIADHIRTLAFAIADGAVPSNEGRGYVLRRILRRAARYGRKIGITDPFLTSLLPVLSDKLGDTYPLLRERHEHISQLIQNEEERFSSTLETGIELFNTIVNKSPAGSDSISGDSAFKLYDTFGFPLDITEDMARERGLSVDVDRFNSLLAEQRTRAKAARSVTTPQLAKVYEELYQQNGDTEFLGYSVLDSAAVILALLDEKGEPCQALEKGQRGWMIVDKTPFYGESGGQEGDTGTVTTESGSARVNDVRRPVHNLFAHDITVSDGSLTVIDHVSLSVDDTARSAIMRHHTATHLFHAALHSVVGVHATQAGSSVNPERLRFDFHQHTALTPEQILEIEQIVNGVIIRDIPVEITETTIDEAKAAGAMMLFDEKYSETVRMIRIGDFSCELCGGTHAPRTGFIGSFQVVDESAIAAGVRRIEAVCGMESVLVSQQQRKQLRDAAALLNISPTELSERIGKLIQDNKALTKKLKESRGDSSKDLVGQALAAQKDFHGSSLVVFNAGDAEADSLRAMSDQLRAQLKSYIIVLGCRSDDKCTFIAQISDDQVKAGRHAGNLVREIAKIAGGGGGGKPNSAQAGGKQPEKLEEALAAVESLLQKPE